MLTPLLGERAFSSVEEPFQLQLATEVFQAPNDPAKWPAFREALHHWRTQTKARLNYRADLYDLPDFSWAASNYSCCFLMLCDERFYDWRNGRYTAGLFLDQHEREFGGFDSVVLWHAYPRIGVDARNQFDFYRDQPGGLEGLREVVRECHRRHVRVYINYNPWDKGTRREGKAVLDALVDMVGALEADGIFLDTMGKGSADFRVKLDAERPGVILEGEGAVPIENIHDHHASWAQWFDDSAVPGVLQHKWLERRHMQHQIKRWNYDHSGELHSAWMNGSGMMVWENVFGSFLPWSGRDRALLRSMLPIQRRYTALFSGEKWTPLIPTEHPVKFSGVYASLWEANGLRLWTVVNRNWGPVAGPLLKVPAMPNDSYFDLVEGQAATAGAKDGDVLLSGTIPARGIACFLSGAPSTLGEGFDEFLQQQARLRERWDDDTSIPRIETQLASVRGGVSASTLPKGMVEVPAAALTLRTSMRSRECGFYDSSPPSCMHNGPQEKDWIYCFYGKPEFQRQVTLKRFAIDETLVTNAQFARFLEDSHYRPKHPENFLTHWNGTRPPRKLADHPVVYIDLDDARAYAKWAGKRLPTEEEWQYAAQGTDDRKFPWGQEFDATRCNGGQTEGTTSVRAFPSGRSPFGCYDMCGNVWQWTESERSDGRTRFCILRGGSWFTATGSGWYTDGGPQRVDFAMKFLMSWPGLDRCSTIGFRCVVDLEA
jgi:Uncharacterized conserved protein